MVLTKRAPKLTGIPLIEEYDKDAIEEYQDINSLDNTLGKSFMLFITHFAP